MKKSFKTGVCKALTTIACATLVFAGALRLNSISAKAATRNLSVDLRNGRVTGFTESDLYNVDDPSQIPQGVKDAYTVMFTTMIYDPNFTKSNASTSHATSVLSSNPYQGIVLDQPDNDTVKVSAMPGSVGTGKYVINKQTIMQACASTSSKTVYVDSETTARIMLLYLDEVTGGDISKSFTKMTEENVKALDALQFNVEIKYSDAPIIANNKVNAAPAVSFEVGKEIEDNGIKYRILDAAGNLSAISLTSKAKTVTIPDAVNVAGYNLNVTDIAQNFIKGNKKTKKVTIGANVTSIGKEAFYKCKKLKKVTIKSTKIESFGKKAFGKDANGFTLKMPKSCKKAYKKLLKKAKIKI